MTDTTYSRCITCGEKIHRYYFGHWRNEEGMFCYRPGSYQGRLHIPAKEEDMKSYTEDQIRKAWKRATRRVEDNTTRRDLMIDTLMDELNEPDYPYGTVWKDAHDVIWYRVMDHRWLRFGQEGTFSDNGPTRPLRQMAEK